MVKQDITPALTGTHFAGSVHMYYVTRFEPYPTFKKKIMLSYSPYLIVRMKGFSVRCKC